jgi:hypothetical protein
MLLPQDTDKTQSNELADSTKIPKSEASSDLIYIERISSYPTHFFLPIIQIKFGLSQKRYFSPPLFSNFTDHITDTIHSWGELEEPNSKIRHVVAPIASRSCPSRWKRKHFTIELSFESRSYHCRYRGHCLSIHFPGARRLELWLGRLDNAACLGEISSYGQHFRGSANSIDSFSDKVWTEYSRDTLRCREAHILCLGTQC